MSGLQNLRSFVSIFFRSGRRRESQQYIATKEFRSHHTRQVSQERTTHNDHGQGNLFQRSRMGISISCDGFEWKAREMACLPRIRYVRIVVDGEERQNGTTIMLPSTQPLAKCRNTISSAGIMRIFYYLEFLQVCMHLLTHALLHIEFTFNILRRYNVQKL